MRETLNRKTSVSQGIAAGWIIIAVVAGFAPVSNSAENADDGTLDVALRSFYFNRAKQELPSSIALTQALMVRYESPYLNNIVGFNASGFGNLKLAAEDGEGGTGLLQDNPDGSQDSYAKLAEVFAKFNLAYGSKIDIGRMELRTPLLNDPDFRASPTTSQAGTFSIGNDVFKAYAIASDKGVAYTETEFSNYSDSNGDDFNIYVAGVDYFPANDFYLSAALGQAENVMSQAYLNARYSWGLENDRAIKLDAYQYFGRADGEGALVGIGPDHKSSLSNVMVQLRDQSTKWTLSLQTVNGDDYLTSWDGGVHDDTSYFSWQSVQRLNFDRAGEDSWQIRFDHEFKETLPGFRVMARYISGSNIENGTDQSGSEWERDIDVAYRPPSIGNLSLIWRYAVVRSSETFDSDEHRLILNYSFRVL